MILLLIKGIKFTWMVGFEEIRLLFIFA